MSYEKALKATGATIHVYEEFGTYEGHWWAKVTWRGQTGWIYGCFGSCSVCDAFEAEFGFISHQCGQDHYYTPIYYDDGFRDNCPKCQEIKIKLFEFGLGYLDMILTQEQAEAKAAESIDWDYEAKYVLTFLKENAIASP